MTQHVTIEQVILCLDDLNRLPRQGEIASDDPETFFRVVGEFEALAVLRATEGWLRDRDWFPTPHQFLEATQAAARDIASERGAQRESGHSCEFCHGKLWGPGTPTEQSGITYETTEPCRWCAPELLEAAREVEKQAARERSRRGEVTASRGSQSYRVGDRLAEARAELVAAGERAKAARS